jgi:hypothetical protein
MTHCHSCGHPITGKAYPKERKVGRTVRDGKEETLLGMVFICKDCADEMDRKAKAKAMARDVGLVILGALLFGMVL